MLLLWVSQMALAVKNPPANAGGLRSKKPNQSIIKETSPEYSLEGLKLKLELHYFGHPVPCKRHRFDPWVGKIPWRRAWQPTPVFLPGESHGQRNLAGCSHRVAQSQTRWKQLSTHAWLLL